MARIHCHEAGIIEKDGGFTIVELMIAMVVFVVVIAGASRVFTGLLTQFKQQSRLAETNIGGSVGLEIMRRDIEQAGYGLPWNLNGATYRETTAEVGSTPWTDRNYNDGPDTNPPRGCASTTCSDQSPTCDPGGCSNPPAPFRSGDGVGIAAPNGTSTIPNSQADLLVIKSTTMAMNSASQKWTYIANMGALPNRLKEWNSPDDPAGSDQVIVLDPGKGSTRDLRNSGGANFYESLGDTTFSFKGGTGNGFEPDVNTFKQFVVYGIAGADATNHIRMPFNRADYFVKRPGTNMPVRCARNTGVLYKAVTNNTTRNDGQCPGGGGCLMLYPILDCVADMQVYYWLDTDNDGVVNWPPASDISNLTAAQIRAQLKEVRVYIVAQEGQKDVSYDFSQGGTRTSFSITEINPNDHTTSQNVGMVNLSSLVGNPEYKYYRWKLYTLVVQPNSMR